MKIYTEIFYLHTKCSGWNFLNMAVMHRPDIGWNIKEKMNLLIASTLPGIPLTQFLGNLKNKLICEQYNRNKCKTYLRTIPVLDNRILLPTSKTADSWACRQTKTQICFYQCCCGSWSGAVCFWASRIRILHQKAKKSKENYFVTFFYCLSLKTYGNDDSFKK